MKTLLLLPNQLFKKHDIDFNQIILYEHPKFFTEYNYHKSKLVFHRATMQKYYDFLNKKYKVKYVNYYDKLTLSGEIIIYNPTDYDILNQIKKICKNNKLNLTILDTKLFILNEDEINEYIQSVNKPYFNATFYKWIRLKKQILVVNNKPIGGSWSFDTLNRKPFLDSYKEKDIKFINNDYIKEATNYCNKNFSDNIGEINIFLPIDHTGADKWFDNFLKERLQNFGPYEDAISSEIILGYHSGISALLNIGLLNPQDIIEETLKLKNKIKIESLEAFIRQVLSWREYTRMLYLKEHIKFNKMNFFNHTNKLKKSWYTGTTGIIPVDNVIKKTLQISYAHHIERLMIIGNFLFLLQIKPKDVYKWFIEMISIDAYEWVMEPNVYGMSQHSVGQLMMNRPYFSSSNYIFKMSNYKKKSDNSNKIILNKKEYMWYEVWDALYYNFINTHKIYLKKNYSTANSVYILNKKSEKEKNILYSIAHLYMKY